MRRNLHLAQSNLGLEAMSRHFPGERRLCYVHRLPTTLFAGRRDPAMRSLMVRHFERNESKVGAAAVAIECGGFAGSLCRSIAAGVLLAGGTRVVTSVFDDAVSGVRWLARRAAGDNVFDADAAIAALRAAGHLS